MQKAKDCRLMKATNVTLLQRLMDRRFRSKLDLQSLDKLSPFLQRQLVAATEGGACILPA